MPRPIRKTDPGRVRIDALTAAGVGTHEKDGSTVFWGATWKDSTTLSSSWTASTEWTTIHPEASVMVTTKRGSELVVFGGTGDLMARSFDPATGNEYSEVEFEGIGDVLAISTTTSDLNGDGTDELLVAAVDAEGALQFLVGHFSSDGGLQKIAQPPPRAWSAGGGSTTDTASTAPAT
ncbi:MAG: hypothetical protein GY913_30985 [Proteobacteria bacterium]|nr:hypothetical protein [Pseudomonadota bacterium]MCP4921343.1 hypothetical protein [Pseudomonadota bacterium]